MLRVRVSGFRSGAALGRRCCCGLRTAGKRKTLPGPRGRRLPQPSSSSSSARFRQYTGEARA